MYIYITKNCSLKTFIKQICLTCCLYCWNECASVMQKKYQLINLLIEHERKSMKRTWNHCQGTML